MQKRKFMFKAVQDYNKVSKKGFDYFSLRLRYIYQYCNQTRTGAMRKAGMLNYKIIGLLRSR